jgi:hypothetical protein
MKKLKNILIICVGVIALIVIFRIVTLNIIQNDSYPKHADGTITQGISEEKNRLYCFGKREFFTYDKEDIGGYSTSIFVLDIADEENVQGYIRHYPYTTDSYVGSIKGNYNTATGIIQADISAYAEKMLFNEREIWKIEN